MKIASTLILVLLIFLSILSGVTKVALMPEDVEFFGRYGFSSPLLIAFGATQLIGGVLMPFRKTRFVGAAIVAVTFLLLSARKLPLGRTAVIWRSLNQSGRRPHPGS